MRGTEFAESYLVNLEPRIIRLPEIDRTHNRIVTVTGVTSSGKDYLLDRCEVGDTVSVLNYGRLLSDQLSVERDEIRQVDPLELIEAQRQCADKVLSSSPSLLNSHVVVKHNGLYVVNYELEKLLNPNYYVAVLTEPEQVRQWRENRNNLGIRSSDIETEEEINFHQEMLLSVLNLIAKVNGNGLITLSNTKSQLSNNIQALQGLMQQIENRQ